MKCIIQRVSSASVVVDGLTVSSIGRGIMVLVGLGKDDDAADVDYTVRKVLNTRVFKNDAGKMWAKGVKDAGLEVLSVSQFTLYGELRGNKPDFHSALGAPHNRTLYDSFVALLRKQYEVGKVQDGAFGEHMHISMVNDGPVTITIDSKKFSADQQQRQKKKIAQPTNEKTLENDDKSIISATVVAHDSVEEINNIKV